MKIHVCWDMRPYRVVTGYYASLQHKVSILRVYKTKLNYTNNAEQTSNHAFFHNAKYYFLTKATITLHVFWHATLFTLVQNTEDSKERISS